MLTAGAGGSGIVSAHWDDSRRAEGYRVQGRSPDGTPVQEILTQDSEAVIRNLAPGTIVAVTVSARNATGESKRSEGVEIEVP